MQRPQVAGLNYLRSAYMTLLRCAVESRTKAVLLWPVVAGEMCSAQRVITCRSTMKTLEWGALREWGAGLA